MLRTALLSFSILLAVQTASACSCAVEDEWAAAAAEYESADVVFEGYLVGHQKTPLVNCATNAVPSDPFQPIGLFKVVEADKGVSKHSTITAKLAGVLEVTYDEHCTLMEIGDSCQHSFNSEAYGSADSPKWLAFTLRNGELWANAHNCSAFPGIGQEVVDRFSKRDTH